MPRALVARGRFPRCRTKEAKASREKESTKSKEGRRSGVVEENARLGLGSNAEDFHAVTARCEKKRRHEKKKSEEELKKRGKIEARDKGARLGLGPHAEDFHAAAARGRAGKQPSCWAEPHLNGGDGVKGLRRAMELYGRGYMLAIDADIIF